MRADHEQIYLLQPLFEMQPLILSPAEQQSLHVTPEAPLHPACPSKVLHENILVCCWENQKIYPLMGGWASLAKVIVISCQVKGRNSKRGVAEKAFCWGLCMVLPAPTIPKCAGCSFLVFCTWWSCASLKFRLSLKCRMVCFKTWKALSRPHLRCNRNMILKDRKKKRERTGILNARSQIFTFSLLFLCT